MADQTPIERAAEALAQGPDDVPYEHYLPDARAALTAALGSVEETARVISEHVWPDDSLDQMTGAEFEARIQRAAEALHAHLLGETETKEA